MDGMEDMDVIEIERRGRWYQDSDSITQSELMRMMNDNSKDEEVQADNYSSYIPTESEHGPRHA